ncbi:hypothetical protein U1763_19350 [Sphingomonas sp. LB2R24]|jgi:hypothetical protein|uniref:hypothetical protein n=1 Tax=Sphingomonas sorbitolis TaxID=3096165 RepID=UPI002FCC1E25
MIGRLIVRPIFRLTLVLGIVAPSVAESPAAAPSAARDMHRIARARFANNAPWYENRIPFFESADPKLDAVYYHRWSLNRAHQRDLGRTGISWPSSSTTSAGSFNLMAA